MKALIEDLLEFSRVQSQVRTFTAVDMREVFDSAVASLGAAIAQSGAHVEAGSLPTVMGDATQLAQLMQNLIGNAIKFHGDSPPHVEVHAEQNGAYWEFSVRDKGIGMDPQYSERIFDVFRRLHTEDEFPGTGIGLAICRRVVERHGGQIWVESQPEVGSVFLFTIPKEGESIL